MLLQTAPDSQKTCRSSYKSTHNPQPKTCQPSPKLSLLPDCLTCVLEPMLWVCFCIRLIIAVKICVTPRSLKFHTVPQLESIPACGTKFNRVALRHVHAPGILCVTQVRYRVRAVGCSWPLTGLEGVVKVNISTKKGMFN